MKKLLSVIEFSEFERPIGIQIFGDTPEVMEKAARLVYEQFKPDLIDINYGCPVPKVTKKGAGSAALKDLCLMEDITAAVVESVKEVPVTVKMRAGWNSETIVSTEAGIKLEKIGIKAITLHPRTTVQLYKGKADWSLIKELKENVKIIDMGDADIIHTDTIQSHANIEKAVRAALLSGAIPVTIGGDHSINIPCINAFHDQGDFHILQIDAHLDFVQTHGEVVGTNNMRKHFSWYFKGFADASALRKKLVLVKNYSEMKDILSNIRH